MVKEHYSIHCDNILQILRKDYKIHVDEEAVTKFKEKLYRLDGSASLEKTLTNNIGDDLEALREANVNFPHRDFHQTRTRTVYPVYPRTHAAQGQKSRETEKEGSNTITWNYYGFAKSPTPRPRSQISFTRQSSRVPDRGRIYWRSQLDRLPVHNPPQLEKLPTISTPARPRVGRTSIRRLRRHNVKLIRLWNCSNEHSKLDWVTTINTPGQR